MSKQLKVKYSRSYLGVVLCSTNYADILKSGGRHEINFHQKHLKAYLSGKKSFNHGYILKDGYQIPKTFDVQEKLEIIEP